MYILLTEYKDAFTAFDKDSNGTISTKDMATVLRSLGMNPSEADLKEYCNEFDAEGILLLFSCTSERYFDFS